MDSSLFVLSVLAGAIGFFMLLRKLIFHQDNNEENSSSSSLSHPSSLSPSSVPPSSSSRSWTHHVFPSFRGTDVRRDFFSHIQMEFQRNGITPFVDNEIKRGEYIGPELVRAIRGSKIAIILLSTNYASSSWCLDELVEIIKCREELGQTVMVVFYKVDPSDVKKLTGDFGKVFRKTCVGKTEESIRRWKQALAKVATIAGYHSSNWENEAAMIKKIATDISNMLNNSTSSSYFVGLVGMRAQLEKLEPLLRLCSIARFAYNQLCNSFQPSVFMENVKAKLQFMSQITNQKDMEIPHLGVLDGVGESVQPDPMASGPGSRPIFTTRDQEPFRVHGINHTYMASGPGSRIIITTDGTNHIYKVDFPSTDKALQILCMYAFGQKSPRDGFEELAREVIALSGKLPLGLMVLGSYFRGMSKQEWTMSLPRLRKRLDADILSDLRLSYDALCAEDKSLFLEIACSFNYGKIKEVEEHLAMKFLDVRERLNVLAEKSLISIYSGSYIMMHTLLEKLGREIVGQQSSTSSQRKILVSKL